MRMRVWWFLGLVLILTPLMALPAGAEAAAIPEQVQQQIDQEIEKQLNELDIGQWEAFYNELPGETKQLMPEGVLAALKQYAAGEGRIDAMSLLKLLGSLLLDQMRQQAGLMIQLVALAFLSGMVSRLSSSFENKHVNEVATLACYCLAVVLMAVNIRQLVVLGQDTIAQMSRLMEIAFPLLMLLLAGSGGTVAAGLIQPTAAVLTSGISVFIRAGVMPLLIAAFVFSVVDNMSEDIHVSQLSDLSRSVCKWLVGSVFTIYVGVISLQGMASMRFDGITYRTAKYAVKQFVPVVGSMFSDSMSMVVGCSLLIQNAAGITALVLLALTCLMPLVRIAAAIGLYKVTAALMQPVADKRMVTCVDAMTKVLTLLFISVLAGALMFFVTFGIAMGAGASIVG